MAVKQRDLLGSARKEGADLDILTQYFQLFQQFSFMPSSNVIIQCCKELVNCLVKTPVPLENEELEKFIEQLNQIQDMAAGVIANVSPHVRTDIVTGILEELYPVIADPEATPYQPACIVLNVLQGEAAEWIVQKGDSSGPVGISNLQTILACLYGWLCSYDCSTLYSAMVMSFIRELEKKEHWDVLNTVSLQYLGSMFDALLGPRAIRESVAPILFHILGSMRKHPEILNKIAPLIVYILESLASDSSQLSRQLLQNVVDITASLISDMEPSKREEYSEITATLDTHMSSNTCTFLHVKAWKENSDSGSGADLHQRNGLINQGNMCYFNSVMQALLLNKSLSRFVIMHMTNVPFWSSMSKIFSHMMFATGPSVDIREYYKDLKPPQFVDGFQHDSSEFLICLLNNLAAAENAAYPLVKKELPPAAAAEESGPSNADLLNPESVSYEIPEAETEIVIECCSTSLKRQREEDDHTDDVPVPPKKRCMRTEFGSFIKSTFSGASVSYTTCMGCGYSSSRPETFREIQLGIPDKLDLVNDYNVQSLLNNFCRTEMLSGDNAYSCGNCLELCDAEKTTVLEDLPKYLVIVLKRFHYNPTIQRHTKLMHQVVLNHVLTVPPKGAASPRKGVCSYRLYATVIHAGTRVDMGHYYTLAVDNGRWYKYNDDRVEQVGELELPRLNHATETPYLLFYRRSDVQEEPQPTFAELPESLAASVCTYNKEHTTVRCQTKRSASRSNRTH